LPVEFVGRRELCFYSFHACSTGNHLQIRASFGFASRLRLAFRYGCPHRLRLAPFIQRDSAHAGHATRGFSHVYSTPKKRG
jgi:hypothetical protein